MTIKLPTLDFQCLASSKLGYASIPPSSIQSPAFVISLVIWLLSDEIILSILDNSAFIDCCLSHCNQSRASFFCIIDNSETKNITLPVMLGYLNFFSMEDNNLIHVQQQNTYYFHEKCFSYLSFSANMAFLMSNFHVFDNDQKLVQRCYFVFTFHCKIISSLWQSL